MRDTYPRRFVLSGLIELTYEDFRMKSGIGRFVINSRRSVFSQQYSLGLQGYIYDPRIAVFSARVTKRNAKSNDNSGIYYSETGLKTVNYDLSATFLPYRQISLSVYSDKTDSTVSSTTSFSYNAFSKSHGAMLKVALAGLPLVKLEYDHWSFDDDRGTKKMENDRFSADLRGDLRSIRTRYFWSFEADDFKGPSRSFTSQHIRGYTDTVIKKDDILRTTFQYSDIDHSKYLGLTGELEMNSVKRFSHDYMYYFTRTETEEAETNAHRLKGRWQYRFTDDLTGSASVGAGTGKNVSKNVSEGGEEGGTSLGFGTDINYRKYIAGLDFRSYYNFSCDRKKEDATEGISEKKETLHNLGFNVITRKLSFGAIHADYAFFSFKSDISEATSHAFNLGVTGKGPGRAYWSLDGGYQRSNGDVFGAEEFTAPVLVVQQGQSYQARGEVGFPLGSEGLVVFNGGYIAGKNEGTGNRSFFYEGRLNYRVLRNLFLLTWWRESWDRTKPNNIDSNTRDVDLTINYRFKMLFFTAEFKAQKIGEATAHSENRSILFRFRRPF
jgi:hypothetical protein